ncbi:MAG: PilN domain-containing protein [Bradyrhizobium sp.]|nr:PilN domain-containing protein [Bradyrhizobium sp.]
MQMELKRLFDAWIAAVAAVVKAAILRIMPQRRVVLVMGDDDWFTVRFDPADGGAKLPAQPLRLGETGHDPMLDARWRAALRGSRVDIRMRPEQLLFREIDFPKQAADFLGGMVRAQIDRLTPWTASEAEFGMTQPVAIANDRIALTVAATSKQRIQPLVTLATRLGAASVAGLVEVPADAEPVCVFERELAHGGGVDLSRLLRLTLLGASLAAAASLLISTYAGSMLDAEQQDLQHRIAQRRAALRIDQGSGSARALLARRKQSSPSSVMVLEAISRVLPDTTYVTELRVEGDKMQVVGLTQDAPSLIKLLEQSPQFTRATFFAPTTRDPSDPGERFHIEAHVTAYFGSGS